MYSQFKLTELSSNHVTKLGDELRSTRSIDIMAYSASLKIRRENYIENFDEQENKETKSAK